MLGSADASLYTWLLVWYNLNQVGNVATEGFTYQINMVDAHSSCDLMIKLTDRIGRIPVILERSACVHFRSPSRVDSKILTIATRSFSLKYSGYGNIFLCFVRKYRFSIEKFGTKKERPKAA